jgi:hypothetical protein
MTGGSLVVINTKDGDGIDSNGSIAISGGTILVSGASAQDNSAIDYETEATLTGGCVVALGSSGMAEGFGSDSTQASVTASVSFQDGDLVSLTDDSGTVLASFRAQNAGSWALLSTPLVVEGTDYSITIGGNNANADDLGYASSGTVSGSSSSSSSTASLQTQSTSGPNGMGMEGDGNLRGFRAES